VKRSTQVTSDREHLRMSILSAIEVELRLRSREVVYGRIVKRSFDDVVIRPWGLRRLRRFSIDELLLIEPVQNLSYEEFKKIRDIQAKGIPTKGKHRKKRRTFCGTDPKQ
jgi:hypothetical protein